MKYFIFRLKNKIKIEQNMYNTFYGFFGSMILSYLIAKVTGMNTEGSRGSYLQMPGGGQIFIFFGTLIGTSIGIGMDVGLHMH
jgi:hypothetical protein